MGNPIPLFYSYKKIALHRHLSIMLLCLGLIMAIKIQFHPHALERMAERGATESEVGETIRHGEQFAAKYGRVGFRRNFPYEGK